MKYSPPIPEYCDENGLSANHNKKFNDLRKYFYNHEKEEIWQSYPKFYIPPVYNKICRKEFVKTEIEKHSIEKNAINTKGISESSFISKVAEKFKKEYLNHAVFPGKGGMPIVPDILLHNEHLNFYLDIEIDEPYAWTKNIETHYAGSDTNRDFDILYANWFILRFTERQIVEKPEQCILQIEHALVVINNIVDKKMETDFERDSLIEEPAWSKSDCTKMMISDIRNDYLSSFTSTRSQISKSMSITDGDSLLIERWFAIPEIWRKVIVESIFNEQFTEEFEIRKNKQNTYCHLISLMFGVQSLFQ